MIHSLISFFTILSVFFSCSSCDKTDNVTSNNTDMASNTLIIKIGSGTFTASLLDNPAVTAFKTLLPLTINMNELNGNEKYADLSKKLVTNASNPGTIKAGDIMLYGSNTLVLFYESFSTAYSYTKLGHINNVTGLADAVGSGNVTVSFELE
jgi:hypothetical protein